MANSIKCYPPTWEGELLLACRNCQKKLKGEPGMGVLAKLKKTIKRCNKEHPDSVLHIISVPCMELCPKGAVTICLAGTRPTMLSVLRNVGEIDELYRRK